MVVLCVVGVEVSGHSVLYGDEGARGERACRYRQYVVDGGLEGREKGAEDDEGEWVVLCFPGGWYDYRSPPIRVIDEMRGPTMGARWLIVWLYCVWWELRCLGIPCCMATKAHAVSVPADIANMS